MAKDKDSCLLRHFLWRFSRIMYYRFEFARGCQDLEWRPGHDLLSHERDRYDMPRISSRTYFLSDKGKPTYLDDLKADIEEAKDQAELKQNIREYVEISRSPPTEHTPAIFGMTSEPFFCRFEENDPRLEEYCRQLVELDNFLVDFIGVNRGSLLPVWPVSFPKANGEVEHQYASLLVGTSIVPALASFIMKERGEDNSHLLKQLLNYEYEEIYKGSKNNPDLLDDALIWGRIAMYTRTEVMEVGAFGLEGTPENPKFYSRATLGETMDSVDYYYDEPFPDSFTGHIMRAIKLFGEQTVAEYSGRFIKYADEEETTTEELANKPSFRRKVLRHMELGARMMDGAYRSLW